MRQKSKAKSKRKAKPMTKKKTNGIAIVSKGITPAAAAPPAAAPKMEPPVPPAPAVKLPPPPANKRITPGAKITDWRVVRSLRAGKPGYFLQGGHFQKTSRGNSFIVGEEFHFTELKKANEALAQKLPPKPKPAVTPSPTPVAAAKNAPAR